LSSEFDKFVELRFVILLLSLPV